MNERIRRPAEFAEEQIIQQILAGGFPTGTTLPGERELAAQLGITRPTVREVLQRLSRDGWLTIQHGRATRVNDIWRDGGLNVLSCLIAHADAMPADFIPNLLAVRLDLAPSYARAAIEQHPEQVSAFLAGAAQLPDTPEAYATFDWALHHTLTVASGNPIYTLILNGFGGFYQAMARHYFEIDEARDASKEFYQALSEAALDGDAALAETITLTVIATSLQFWERVDFQRYRR